MFAIAPRGTREADRLLRSFAQKVEADKDEKNLDVLLVEWMWESLKGAAPRTVADYAERLVRRLADLGVQGVKTRRYKQAKQTLRRFSVMVRPNRAVPVKTPDVICMLDALRRRNDPQAEAAVALTWLSRARISDLKYLMSEDIRLLNDGSLAVYLKEKQQRKWMPPVYVPYGDLLERVTPFLLSTPGFLFGGDDRTDSGGKDGFIYDAMIRRIRKVAPPSFWTHSLRRGATQQIEANEAPTDEEMRSLLRHNSARQTKEYMAEVSTATMERERRLTRSLQ